MLIVPLLMFFAFMGRFKRLLTNVFTTGGRCDRRGRQGLQLGGR